MMHFDKIPLYGVFALSIGMGVVVAVVVRVVVVPWQRRKIESEWLNVNCEKVKSTGEPRKCAWRVRL